MNRSFHGDEIMKFRIFSLLVLSLIIALTLCAQKSTTSLSKTIAEGMTGATEVRYWDSTKAYNGYTLFAASGKSYLIDMEGYIINQWNIGTNPRLLDNGNLLDATKSDPSNFTGFAELDWNGNTVWSYTEQRKTTYFLHHDFTRIYNKKLKAYTTMYIANKNVTRAQALAAGANPANIADTVAQMDAIVEVDLSGNIVWEWWFFDHVIQDYDSTKANYVGKGKKISDYPGKININLAGVPLRKDWLHCNSIDYNDSLDQVVINCVAGEFYIIDHGNTFIAGNPSASIAAAATYTGDFLYRFGDPARYGQGNPPSIGTNWTTSTTGNKQIGGSHDVHWIKPGLPGAGNIQIFNNGEYLFERTSQSYIFEVNPTYNSQKVSTSAYVNPPDAGYYTWIYPNNDAMKQNKFISKQVVWIYCSKNDQSFFSTIGGSEQRLPNKNTLICSDTQGHLFEVTYGDTVNSPQLVWEYINPITTDGIKTIITDQYPMYNSVFRAYRYTATHPALQGKSLGRKATITGKIPQYLKPSTLISGITTTNAEIPKVPVLHQNYPNPFNPTTVISYELPVSSMVQLKVHNIVGKEIVTLVNQYQQAATYNVSFDSQKYSLSSGIYFYRITAGNYSKLMKMVILK
jgi:hypothetical protein